MKYPIVLLLCALTVPAIAASTDWPSALHGIASGDTHWIEQAPTLAATADAGAGATAGGCFGRSAHNKHQRHTESAPDH